MEMENKLTELIEKELKAEANELKPDENIRLAALKALRAKKERKKTSVLPLLFNYKVPIWTAAAAIVLMLLLLPSVFSTDVNTLGNNGQLAVHDTVYVDRIINDTIEIVKSSNPVIKTVYVQSGTSSNTSNTVEIKIEEMNVKPINTRGLEYNILLGEYSSKIDLNTQISGRSLSDDLVAKAVLGK